MDAKTFISKKHDAAVAELEALEAEYRPKMDAAKSMITMTQQWLSELGVEKVTPEPEVSLQDVAKSAASSSWMSNRDLTPPSRQS